MPNNSTAYGRCPPPTIIVLVERHQQDDHPFQKQISKSWYLTVSWLNFIRPSMTCMSLVICGKVHIKLVADEASRKEDNPSLSLWRKPMGVYFFTGPQDLPKVDWEWPRILLRKYVYSWIRYHCGIAVSASVTGSWGPWTFRCFYQTKKKVFHPRN